MHSVKTGDLEYDISHRVLPLLLLWMSLGALLNDVKEMFWLVKPKCLLMILSIHFHQENVKAINFYLLLCITFSLSIVGVILRKIELHSYFSPFYWTFLLLRRKHSVFLKLMWISGCSFSLSNNKHSFSDFFLSLATSFMLLLSIMQYHSAP